MATKNFACCSEKCRIIVPNCELILCNNATVPGIHKGIRTYSTLCYKHGGRTVFDNEVQPNNRKIEVFVLTSEGWILAQLK